jgi:hypothetical protein
MRNFGLKERQDVVQTFWTSVNEATGLLADLPSCRGEGQNPPNTRR